MNHFIFHKIFLLSLSYLRMLSDELFFKAELNKKFGLKTSKKLPGDPVIDIRINFYFNCYACTKHFSKNWLFSNLYFMSSFEIIFPEVKHRRKILINQLPLKLEPNIRKKFNYFLGTESKFFIMCLKENILRSRFLPFLDDFRYA
jgi:hypothetical protein